MGFVLLVKFRFGCEDWAGRGCIGIFKRGFLKGNEFGNGIIYVFFSFVILCKFSIPTNLNCKKELHQNPSYRSDFSDFAIVT